MISIHPEQADPKYNHNSITCRDCVQLQLYVDDTDASIDTQMIKPLNNMLVHLSDLDYGIIPDIGTLNKERGDIFLECDTEIFKAKLL